MDGMPKQLFRASESRSRWCAAVLALGACLLTVPAHAREGDLDPAFGDVGRVGPIPSVPGAAWSIHQLNDGSLVIGGGAVSRTCPSDICEPPGYVGFSAHSFLIHVSDAGQLLESHDIRVSDFHLLAIARQDDGKFVVAGRRLNERSLDSDFVVYRLNPDGAPDVSFGTDGLIQLPLAERGEVDEATGVLVESDGRIVVAGSRLRSGHRSQVLIRLLTNGEFDQAFGASGIVILPGRDTSSVHALELPLFHRTQVLRTDAGAYRVSVPNWCRIMGLAPDGSLDPAFGSSGSVQIDHPISNGCSLMIATQSDGRLVVGASDGEAAVVTRLLADGQPDTSFLRGTSWQDRVGYIISALAAGPDDSTFIALGLSDFGYHGLEVKKLLPNGLLDETFGAAGSAKIDMPSEFGGSAYLLFDMLVREEGAIVGTGGKPFSSHSDGPIVVQLLGPDAGDGPGVLSMPGWRKVDEELTDLSVEVRRTGGDAGHVSVAYEIVERDVPNAATAGDDFVVDAGRLEWEDGDTANRQIQVRIIDDATPEDVEQFAILLKEVDGGAGLGTRGTIIEIAANDGPPGEIGFESTSTSAYEGEQFGVRVTRTGGSTGAVSVNFEIEHDSTDEQDFVSLQESGTLTWQHGDTENKLIGFIVADDQRAEKAERFRFVLTQVTEGATIAAERSTVTVHIAASDGTGDRGGGGGGAVGFLMLTLLAILYARRCWPDCKLPESLPMERSLLIPVRRKNKGNSGRCFLTWKVSRGPPRPMLSATRRPSR